MESKELHEKEHNVAKARQIEMNASAASRLAVCDRWACVAAGKVGLRLVDLANGDAVHEVATAPAACACFDAAGARLLAGGDDKRVCLWDALPPPADGATTRSWTANKKIGCVAFSPDGATVLWADLFGEVYGAAATGDAASAAAPTIVLGHLSPLSHLMFTPCSCQLLSADREGHVRASCWPEAYIIDGYYLEHTTPLSLLVPFAQAPLLATAAYDGQHLCLWVRGGEAELLGRMPTARLRPSSQRF